MKTTFKSILIILVALASFACKDKHVLEPANAPTGAPLSEGDSYGGGIIIYVESGGTHGLIAANYDASNFVPWSPPFTTNTGATSISIYSGATNTNLIVSIYGSGSYAAYIADQYVEDGYSDWYLPSKDELNKIYLQKSKLNLYPDYYWSSTETSSSQAYTQDVAFSGSTSILSKTVTKQVRTVRRF